MIKIKIIIFINLSCVFQESENLDKNLSLSGKKRGKQMQKDSLRLLSINSNVSSVLLEPFEICVECTSEFFI